MYRTNGEYFEADALSVLPYVSAAVAAELADPEDLLLSMTRPLETLADLRDADNFTVRVFGETVAGISDEALLKHRAALRETDLTRGACPPDKNHKLAARTRTLASGPQIGRRAWRRSSGSPVMSV